MRSTSKLKQGEKEALIEFMKYFADLASGEEERFALSDGEIATPWVTSKNFFSNFFTHAINQLVTEDYIKLEFKRQDKKESPMRFMGKETIYPKEFQYVITGCDPEKMKQCSKGEMHQIRARAGAALRAANARLEELEKAAGINPKKSR